MRNLKERKQRLSLTLLFAGLVFLFLLLTMILIVGVILILMRHGFLKLGEGRPVTSSFLLILALISILAGTVLAGTVGRFPLRPVNGIINAMNRLAAGDFKTRLTFSGPMGNYPIAKELTESFNKMAAELESTEMLRSDFINNFSHEFKTPIVSIAGFAKLLKKGCLTPEEQTEYLNIIEDESLRLSAMATNVLNLTKVENQSILTDLAEYNLSEQLRTCVLMLEKKWNRKNLDLILNFDEYFITANEELMKQVWINLIDNAIKFTPDSGCVEITVSEEPENIIVSVMNSGSEIPAESMSRIFQKFYQADESHATEGNGIGLAIVQKVVELHGGEVSVESKKGRTAFSVTLPARKVAEVREE